MKELTIEEKAARYDEAIDIARKINSGEGVAAPSGWTTCEVIFPELKENEDEKIRKELIRAFKSFNTIKVWNGIERTDILAWLEKQDGYSIHNVPSREVILTIWDLGNEWKELTNGSISTEYGTQLDYIQKHWTESEYYIRKKQGEQKPILDFNADDWYASKVDNKLHNMTYNSANKVKPKPADWSEEDEDYINDLIKHFSQNERLKNTKEDIVIWLKSIKPQKQWKPSKEQMEALWNVYEGGEKQSALASLYNDLKKLKE